MRRGRQNPDVKREESTCQTKGYERYKVEKKKVLEEGRPKGKVIQK